jgi:hypothetical protein
MTDGLEQAADRVRQASRELREWIDRHVALGFEGDSPREPKVILPDDLERWRRLHREVGDATEAFAEASRRARGE